MNQVAHNSTSEPTQRRRLLALTLGVEGGLFALAAALALVADVPLWEQMRWNARALISGAALSLPPVALAVALAQSSWGPLRRFREDFDLVVSLFKDLTLLDILCISILAGLGEEALFRGFLQPFIAGFGGVALSLLVTALVFGALHALSRVYFVFAPLISLYLGALYLWFDSLLTPIAAHALYDFLALAYGARVHGARKSFADS